MECVCVCVGGGGGEGEDVLREKKKKKKKEQDPLLPEENSQVQGKCYYMLCIKHEKMTRLRRERKKHPGRKTSSRSPNKNQIVGP